MSMPAHQSLSLADGMHGVGLSYPQLWTRYIALGGTSGLVAMTSHLDSDSCPDDVEHNLIAQALNDAYVESGQDHPVAYRHLYQLNAPPEDR